MYMADKKTTKNPEELHKIVAEKREALRAIRFGAAGSRSRNVREGRTTRKEIARALTDLSMQKIASRQKKA